MERRNHYFNPEQVEMILLLLIHKVGTVPSPYIQDINPETSFIHRFFFSPYIKSLREKKRGAVSVYFYPLQVPTSMYLCDIFKIQPQMPRKERNKDDDIEYYVHVHAYTVKGSTSAPCFFYTQAFRSIRFISCLSICD